jgi:hypothetical protein
LGEREKEYPLMCFCRGISRADICVPTYRVFWSHQAHTSYTYCSIAVKISSQIPGVRVGLGGEKPEAAGTASYIAYSGKGCIAFQCRSLDKHNSRRQSSGLDFMIPGGQRKVCVCGWRRGIQALRHTVCAFPRSTRWCCSTCALCPYETHRHLKSLGKFETSPRSGSAAQATHRGKHSALGGGFSCFRCALIKVCVCVG